MSTTIISTQNDLLMKNLNAFYSNHSHFKKMLGVINGESRISLRIVDWFATNYAKMNFSVYDIKNRWGEIERFNVYRDYKLKLKAYSKKRFDPFCRWERITIPYNNKEGQFIQTTIGQLNFFKWAIENRVIQHIEENYKEIENDMNTRNSTAKKVIPETNKTRKKREELSISAVKTVKKENIEIIVNFN